MSTHPAGLLLLDHISRSDIAGFKSILTSAADMIDINWTNPLTGLNPVHTAVNSGDLKVLRAVLEFQPKEINAKTTVQNGGNTPLHLAVLNNQPGLLEILLKNRADPHLLNAAGFSPMHLAAQRNSVSCLETLLSRGAADAALPDSSGRTAGWWAAVTRSVDAAALLPEEAPVNWDAEILRGVTLAQVQKLFPTSKMVGGGDKKKETKKGDKKKKKK